MVKLVFIPSTTKKKKKKKNKESLLIGSLRDCWQVCKILVLIPGTFVFWNSVHSHNDSLFDAHIPWKHLLNFIPIIDGSGIAQRGAEPLLEQPLAERCLAAVEGLQEGALYSPGAAILQNVQIIECDAVKHLDKKNQQKNSKVKDTV